MARHNNNQFKERQATVWLTPYKGVMKSTSLEIRTHNNTINTISYALRPAPPNKTPQHFHAGAF